MKTTFENQKKKDKRKGKIIPNPNSTLTTRTIETLNQWNLQKRTFEQKMMRINFGPIARLNAKQNYVTGLKQNE